jgi:hypothetical protein
LRVAHAGPTAAHVPSPARHMLPLQAREPSLALCCQKNSDKTPLQKQGNSAP